MRSAVAFLGVLALLGAEKPQQIPRKAPELAIQTAPTSYIWLSQYTGKTVILAFILTTCPHCQFTTGVLNRVQKDYASRGVQVLATAVDPMSALYIPDFEKKFSPAFPVGYNDQTYIAKFLGLPPNDPMFFPQLVFIDKNGVIRAHLDGDNPGMAKDIQDKTIRDTLEKTFKESVPPAVRK